jgi:ribose transport system permease protein
VTIDQSARHEQVTPPGGATSAGGLRKLVGGLFARNAVLLVLLFTFVAFSILRPESFFTTANVKTMIISQAVVLIIALGLTLPLRAGDMDLSIAGVVAASASVLAVLASNGVPTVLCVLAALGVGLLVGLVNAFFAIYLGVDSFVVTLGMFTLLSGVAYGVTSSRVVTGVPESIVTFASTNFLGLPAVVWYAWILVAVVWYVYEKTPLGRYMLFVGGNRAASRLAGVNVSGIRLFAFLGASLLGSVAGILVAGDFGAVDPSIAGQYLLAPFAAAFLGATTIHVGRFNAVGTVIALYLLVVGITGLQLLGAQSWVGGAFNGAALIISVALARIVSRRRDQA